MSEWTDEVYDFFKERRALISEINKSVNLAKEELKGILGPEFELLQRRIDVELPGVMLNPVWTIVIDESVIIFTLRDIRENRVSQDDIGQHIYDEDVSIDSVVKKIITERIKSL